LLFVFSCCDPIIGLKLPNDRRFIGTIGLKNSSFSFFYLKPIFANFADSLDCTSLEQLEAIGQKLKAIREDREEPFYSQLVVPLHN
jgi:hypothetical protein